MTLVRAFVGLYLLVSATALAEGKAEPQAAQATPQPAPQPQPAPPLPRDRCAVVPPKGAPIFEARYTGAQGRGVVTRLYATGTYTRVLSKPKTKPDQQVACIDKARLENVMVAIKSAAWQTTKNPATCAAVSNEATDIFVLGKKRFTAKVCSPLSLDDKSSAALDLVANVLGPFGIDLVDDLLSD